MQIPQLPPVMGGLPAASSSTAAAAAAAHAAATAAAAAAAAAGAGHPGQLQQGAPASSAAAAAAAAPSSSSVMSMPPGNYSGPNAVTPANINAMNAAAAAYSAAHAQAQLAAATADMKAGADKAYAAQAARSSGLSEADVAAMTQGTYNPQGMHEDNMLPAYPLASQFPSTSAAQLAREQEAIASQSGVTVDPDGRVIMRRAAPKIFATITPNSLTIAPTSPNAQPTTVTVEGYMDAILM